MVSSPDVTFVLFRYVEKFCVQLLRCTILQCFTCKFLVVQRNLYSLVTCIFSPRCICHIDCFKRFLLIWLSRAYALKSMIDALGKPPSSLPHQKKKKRKRVKKLFIIRRKKHC
uniref:Uncharacterized protein n=1 Tax=Opuntia streptacantha TaxID=393608 RepID=A0A7C9ADD8_OPUST